MVFTPGAGEVGISAFPTLATVTRLLPMEAGGYQYHIHVGTEGVQRRAREDQLRPS